MGKLLIRLVGVFALSAVFLTGVTVPATALSDEAKEMIALTNDDRTDRDIAALKVDRELSRYAKRHSKAMARRGELFHTRDLGDVLRGVNWRVAGENVGYGFTGDLPGLQRAFMDSPGHRANILDRDYDRIATGVYVEGDRVWVTVIFYGR